MYRRSIGIFCLLTFGFQGQQLPNVVKICESLITKLLPCSTQSCPIFDRCGMWDVGMLGGLVKYRREARGG